jgi:hypothetical protein
MVRDQKQETRKQKTAKMKYRLTLTGRPLHQSGELLTPIGEPMTVSIEVEASSLPDPFSRLLGCHLISNKCEQVSQSLEASTGSLLSLVREQLFLLGDEERLALLGNIRDGICTNCGRDERSLKQGCRCWDDE